MNHRTTSRTARAIVALALGAAVALGGSTAATAVGGGSVTVALAADPARQFVADTAGPTAVTLQGSGFQSIEGGFGGIYVLFGWVAPGWEPTAGGVSGVDYRYAIDDPDAPAGFQSLVAFPGSQTAGEATGGVIDASGTWATGLTIGGPVFEPADAAGTGESIDCTLVQCGVITLGAHGVVNPGNETFTPIDFVDLSAAAEPAPEPAAEPNAEPNADDEVDTVDAEPAASAKREALPGATWLVAGAVAVALVAAGLIIARRRAMNIRATNIPRS